MLNATAAHPLLVPHPKPQQGEPPSSRLKGAGRSLELGSRVAEHGGGSDRSGTGAAGAVAQLYEATPGTKNARPQQLQLRPLPHCSRLRLTHRV